MFYVFTVYVVGFVFNRYMRVAFRFLGFQVLFRRFMFDAEFEVLCFVLCQVCRFQVLGFRLSDCSAVVLRFCLPYGCLFVWFIGGWGG